MLGIPVPLEIEDKYILQSNALEIIRKHVPIVAISEIVQTYILDEAGQDARLRMRTGDGHTIYTLTRKIEIAPGVREEIEVSIDVRQYAQLIHRRKGGTGTVLKTRYCFAVNDIRFELDEYRAPALDAVIMEAEKNERGQIIRMSDWLGKLVIKNVTGELRWTNAELAKLAA
jgi:CYTH domain-containing protein